MTTDETTGSGSDPADPAAPADRVAPNDPPLPETALPHARYVELLTTESALLASAAGRDLDAPVPYCDGWRVRDLVAHAGEVFGHKATVVAERWPVDAARAPARPTAGDDVLVWYAEQRRLLLDAFDRAEPDDAVWSWAPGCSSVRFWARRMAQEALVHRIDAEAATGALTPTDAELVVDGIDEVLGTFLVNVDRRGPPSGDGATVRIACAGREWRSIVQADRVGFARGGGAAAATVTGEPLPMLLWLWGRAPADAVGIAGDGVAVGRLRVLLREATQ
jgi:uncharacterized protein (TIGR03083 family)